MVGDEEVGYIIEKEDVKPLISGLSGYEVYGPVEKKGVMMYQNLHEHKLVLDFGSPQKSPKEVLFPQTEKLFDLKKEGGRFDGIEKDEFPDDPMLLIGVRPCDARSIQILDKVFSQDPPDPYFLNKRERTTLISFGCQEPGRNCFCPSVDGGPHSSEEADQLWTDLGERYYVEILSEKGERIYELGEDIFSPATTEDREKADRVKKEAKDGIERGFEREGIEDRLEERFESEEWEEIAQRCLGCGICTLQCPTCHCFDINDIMVADSGWRERTWDSCQYKYYTIHASGFNPRPEKEHRFRNRLYHKYLYMPKNIDSLGCVGCGRCISNCPTNIDLLEVIQSVK